MSDFNLGRAEGEIALKYNPTGAAKAREDLNQVEKGGQRAGASLGKAGTGMAIAGVAIAGGLAVAINAAANFEQRLSAIKAVSGATTGDMELIRKKALQLGADTKFSASEAAQAMEELAKAGISIPDIMNGAADATVALAAAGEIDLPHAAEIAANAMNAFGLSAKELPKVADLIAGAANASAIDVGQFAQAMQQAGAAAHLAGIEFPDLAAAIALMGNAGIKGSDAGTSLKTMLLNLNPQTKKQIDLMKKLGIITKSGANQFFDARGKAKSLADISQVLQDALKGQTKQQQLATLSTLFGSDAIRAAAVLANSGAKGFDNMSKAMGKVKAADVAATRMDNLKGTIEQLKGSLETSAIIVGSIFLPALATVGKVITQLLNSFAGLSGRTQQIVAAAVAAAAAFLLIAGAGLKLIGLFQALSGAISAAFLANPVALIVVAIVAAIAALAIAVVLLYKNFQPVRDVVDAVGRALKNAFIAVLPIINTVVAGVKNFVAVLTGASSSGSGFVGFMGQVATVLRDVVIPAIIAVGKFLLATFGPIITQVISIVSGFITSIIGYFQSIAPQLAAIGNAIRAVWNVIWPPLLVIVKFVFSTLLSFVISTLQLLATGIRILLAGIANIFRGVFNIIGGIVKVFLSVLTGNWSGAWEGIKQIVKGALQIVLGIIQAIVGGVIVAICVSSLKVIGSVFRAGFSLVRSVVTGSINAVRAVIAGGMAAARAVVSAALNAIKAVFTGNLRALAGIARGAINLVVGAFRAGLAAARSVVSGGLSGIVGAVRGLAGQMFSAGAEIIGRLVSGITSRIGDAVGAVKGALGKIAGLVPHSPVKEGPLKVLNRGHAGKQIMNMLIDGINARRGDLAAAMANATLSVPTTILGTTSALSDSAARTSNRAGTTIVTPAGADSDALAAAVLKGLGGARFEFDGDGIARIVAGSFGPSFVMGARA